MLKGHRAASAFVAALALVSATCAVHNPSEPALSGPSVLSLSLVLTATPDTINQDGFSQSAIVVMARDPNGRGIAGLALRLEIQIGGIIQDFGSLSARTVVTNNDGRASAVYTAPPPPPPLAGGAARRVSILAIPIGTNFQTTNAESVDIRLTTPGVILPPADTPTAQFTVTPTPVNLNLPARFDASTSCGGPIGGGVCRSISAITSYVWDFGDSTPTQTGVTTNHTFRSAQVFNVTLTVTNDRGVPASTTQQVTVTASAPPTAKFVFSPASPVVGTSIVFNADGSTAAPGRTIVQYSWIYGDGTTDSGFLVTHSYSVANTYNVTLTVRDDLDQKATTSQSVTVGTGNPVAAFTFSPTTPAPNAPVTFDGSLSTPASGASIVSYTWAFPGGTPSSSGPNTTPGATTIYPPPAGSFTVTLTVTDNLGRKGFATQTVTTK